MTLLLPFLRKSRLKRMIRVPAISSKIADIPADEYSWRKYGQKPIKGSPYPRYFSSSFSYYWIRQSQTLISTPFIFGTLEWYYYFISKICRRLIFLFFVMAEGITSAVAYEGVQRGSTWSGPRMTPTCSSLPTRESTVIPSRVCRKPPPPPL